MKPIEKLIKQLKDFRNKRGWKKHHKPKDLAVSISIEAAELLEHFQWKKSQEEVENYIEENKEEIADEIADIMNYLLTMADDLDMDVIENCRRKMKKNAEKYPLEEYRDKN